MGAITELRQAVHYWTDADLPFETAHARRWLASAHRADGDEGSAALELRSAHATFQQLGAVLEAARCARMIEAVVRDSGHRVARVTTMSIRGSPSRSQIIAVRSNAGPVRPLSGR